jgi:hypothetical protein
MDPSHQSRQTGSTDMQNIFPGEKNAQVRKYLFSAFVFLVFAKLFLFSWDFTWHQKYQLFGVPAFSYPGADARNIQMAAHCTRAGFEFFGENECQKAAKPIREHYPEASAPVLNYPSWWARFYGLFKDDSEQFFLTYWTTNALLLAAAILILCLKYNYLAFPLFLFSPITLLTIERGNNDGSTFFFTFVPLLAFAFSRKLQAFALGLAAALKIFPFFGYLAFLQRKPPFAPREAIIGAFCAAPFFALSFWELPHLLAGTGKGFGTAFGLPSLSRITELQNYPEIAYLLMALFVLLAIVIVRRLWKSELTGQALHKDFTSFTPSDLFILSVSSAIYLLTFFLFNSWAYRLIFIIPAFLVLSKGTSRISRIICLNILFVFWIPMAPFGWIFENVGCMPLAVLLSYLFLRCMAFRMKMPAR